MPIILPIHVPLITRSPTSRLGNPTGNPYLRPTKPFLTFSQQQRRRSNTSKNIPAGLYFDKRQNHKDLKTCHRIYRPLHARPSTAASRTYGPTSPRNRRDFIRRKKYIASSTSSPGQSGSQFQSRSESESGESSETDAELYLDAGGSVSSNAGWISRYPATYRAITITAGEMPRVKLQTTGNKSIPTSVPIPTSILPVQIGYYPNSISISNYSPVSSPVSSPIQPITLNETKTTKAIPFPIPRSPTPPNPQTNGIIASLDWPTKNTPVSRYNSQYVCFVIRIESCITGELNVFYSCKGNYAIGPIPNPEESILIDPKGVEHPVLWHEELLRTNNSKYQLVEGILSFSYIFMEHNEDQIERISNVLPGLPSMTSFVYGGRPLSRPGWWSEAALRPCTINTTTTTTTSKNKKQVTRSTASNRARQKPILWKRPRTANASIRVDRELMIQVKQRKLRNNSRGISQLTATNVYKRKQNRKRPKRPSTGNRGRSDGRNVKVNRSTTIQPSHSRQLKRQRPGTYQPIGVRFPPKRQNQMYSKHRDFRIHTGRPATGLAGVRAIVPPDVTPRLIEDTENTEGDTDSATEINEMQRIKNDAMRYTQVLVSSAIARATKRVILPMLERSLTQVINLKLDVKEGKGQIDKEKEKDKVQEGEREKEKEKEEVEDMKMKLVQQALLKRMNEEAKEKEDASFESVVYLDKWVKTAVEDELRRREIIEHHHHEVEKQERLSKLYSKDREHFIDRLTQENLGEMWDTEI